jgi:hypothetical protein
MKRLLGITLTLASLGTFGLSSEANASESRESITVAANASPQWERDRYGRRYNNRRRAYSVRRSRVVRYGRRLYRETYLVRYFPSGRTNTRLISRVRIA